MSNSSTKLPANIMGQLKEYIKKEKITYVINYMLTLDYGEKEIFDILTGKPFCIDKDELFDIFIYHYSFDVDVMREVAYG